MSSKKHGNYLTGGDKKTRDKVNRRNPRGAKKGGRKSKIRGRNTFLKGRLKVRIII